MVSGHALVTQQRVDRRFAAPEGLERFHGRPAAAGFQDGTPVFSASFYRNGAGDGLVVSVYTCRCGDLCTFLEGCIGVGRENFSPFVAVVPGGVTAEKM